MECKCIRMVEYETEKSVLIKVCLCSIFNIPYENANVRKALNEEYPHNTIFIEFNHHAYSCTLKEFNEVPIELLLRNIILGYANEKISMIKSKCKHERNEQL